MSPSTDEVTHELVGWAVGGGIITMALFPFALPLLMLTAVVLVPLVPLALLALPILLGRALWQRHEAKAEAHRRGSIARPRTSASARSSRTFSA
jgi:hypothetical protein